MQIIKVPRQFEEELITVIDKLEIREVSLWFDYGFSKTPHRLRLSSWLGSLICSFLSKGFALINIRSAILLLLFCQIRLNVLLANL